MTTYSADLLKKYNKKKTNVTEVPKKTETPLATLSYANKYDALYEHFSKNKNFNESTWNNAMKLGKQDTYFSLLEKNKDTRFSDEFYDPLYYNYESNMLELYKSSADNNDENAQEYFEETFDAVTNKYVEQSIGKMTEAQYIQYQLDKVRASQTAEITRDLENQRKENMSWIEKTANTAAATAGEFGEGLVTGTTGILDFGIGLGWATVGAVKGENWLDSYVNYFAEEGLTAQSKATIRASLDEWERKNTYIKNIDGEMEPVGKYLAGISNSIGMMVPSILTNVMAPGAGMPLFYTSIYTNNLYDNATNPATENSPNWLKVTNAVIDASVEAVVEWGLAKVLGGTIQNEMLGLTSKFGKASILKTISKTAGLQYLAKSALQEGLEEFLQDFSTNLVDQFTGNIYEGYQHTGVNFQTLIDSFMIGMASSLVMSGGKIMQNSASNRIATMTKGKHGNAYPFIETETGELKSIKGAKQLAWSDMMSNFNAAIEKLKKGKMSMDKNLELAQEIQGGLTIMTQLYSSFGTERLENSQKLLQKVAEAEQKAKEKAQVIVKEKAEMKKSDATKLEMQFAKEYAKQIKKKSAADFAEARTAFVTKIDTDIKEMIGGAYSRRILRAITENAEKLQENGVTEVQSVVSADSITKKDPAITELDNILQDKYDDFLEEYDYIFGTDGHVAIEDDKMLFVPIAWLKNYKNNDIYKFLAQEKILSSIIKDKGYKKLTDKLVEHNKEFTKNKIVTKERALMDLFFNESVFQHFLLSESGKNLHEFKGLISSLFVSMKLSGKQDIQLTNILKDIKKVWRVPLMKGVLNWNMDLQKIGADGILSEADKNFINKYKIRQRMSIAAAKGGPIASNYRRIVKDLIENGKFLDKEKTLIEKGLKNSASTEDRLKAVMLLNFADDRYIDFDFDHKKDIDFSNAFILPMQAFSTDLEIAAVIQQKADALIDFKKTYGISAKSLMFIDLKTLTSKQQNKIKTDMATLGISNQFDFVARKLEIMLGDKYVITPTYNINKENIVNDFVMVKKIPAEQLLSSNIVSPPNGTRNDAFINMFAKNISKNDKINALDFLNAEEDLEPRSLLDFLQANDNLKKNLSDWKIEVRNVYSNTMAFTNFGTKTIVLNRFSSDDFLADITHEINHAIQFEYGMSRGFNSKMAKHMPEFLEYILDEYKELIIYTLRRLDKPIYADMVANTPKDMSTKKVLTLENRVIKQVISFIGYRLVQGEVWAEHHIHNGKPVKAFSMLQTKTGNGFLVSPDGKRKFEIPVNTIISSANETIEIDDIQIENALSSQFDEILGIRSVGYDNEDDIRNTYHASLSHMSASELVQNIINQNLSISTKTNVTIDEIILNPKQYLSQKMWNVIKKRGNDEGAAYYGLKQWFEDNIKGVSIDRDAITHEYVFVDDNAFDDILGFELSDKIHDDSHNDLVLKYSSEDGISLNRFYSMLQLSRLGLPSNIKVIINENVSSETIIDKDHKQGVITINVSKKTTNAELIDTLNHEFRHLLQYYSGFETGFTPNFVVTKEMLDDIKKHVPAIFNEETRAWAKLNNSQNPDAFIAQRFVYYMVGGEQNAYSFKSAWLNVKPIFVTKEAGRPTIFMPWYDAKTGDGRYITDFLANRANNDKGIKIPKVKREPKYKKGIIDDIDSDTPKRTYIYKRDRFFSKEKAKGTNLEGFKQDMDPDLQDFIIATTGKEKQLPKELIYAIKKKKLTKQALYKYFRNAKTTDINDFTFNLINKYMFKNSTIKNMKELDTLVNLGETKHGKGGVAFWWAAAVVLKREGLEIESLIKENDTAKFINFMKSLEGSQWQKKIDNVMKNFNWYYVQNKKTGKIERKEIGVDQATSDYMRVFAMQFFNGSLAGAFYTAKTFRRIVRLYQNKTKEIELDKAVHADANVSLQDMITDTGLIADAKQYGNDIIAMYGAEVLYKSTDEMIAELVQAVRPLLTKRAKEVVKRKSNLTETQRKKMVEKLVNTNLLHFGKQLLEMSADDIAIRYEQIKIAEMTGLQTKVDITDTSKDLGTQTRKQIVANIKRYATNINNFVLQGKIVWSNLPLEVRNMFETTTEIVNGKKVIIRSLKPEVYSVGHVTGKGKGRVASDTTKILKNKDLLRQVSHDAKRNVFASKEISNEVQKLQRKLDKNTKRTFDFAKNLKSKNIKTNKRQGEMRTAEFDVRGRKSKISDTPNNFSIVSPIKMPTILYKIFDVSFADMSNTEVKFASIDKNGNLLTKDTDKKTFDSQLKHEVNNWDAFYETARPLLLELTRNDVLDIVEFIHAGITTSDGPTNKMAAFQIFTLGYILDGARHNVNNWNFSNQEIDFIRKVYESKASEYGSGLNAVSQMLKVIDPVKKVRQRMLDEYGVTDAELEPLFSALDEMQTEKNLSARKEKAIEVSELLQEIEVKMEKGDTRKKGFGKRWYQKTKSARYSFMLSSPTTWIRNIVSNVVLNEFNKGSDILGNIIFKGVAKKAYRKEQWDLANTSTSKEVYTFIEENIKNSELFEYLYDGTSKYDDRSKNVDKQKELFQVMITKAIERKYAAEHRFDAAAANNISKFVGRMISDKRFVKKAAGRYLGKILTIEVNNKNINLDEGLSNKVLDLFAEAVILANEDYMHKRSFMADMVDGLREKHPVWYEVLNWWQPFLNSSFNWFQETLKYTPLGLISSIYKMCTLEKRITKMDIRRSKGELVTNSRLTEYLIRRDIGKGTIGLVLTTLGIMLGAFGILKIEDDDDKFYMIIGDVKIDISNIFGTSSILIGASIAQIGNQKFDVIMKNVAEAMFEGFMLKDILDYHQWDGNFYEAMLTETNSILRSFVPQIVQLMIRTMNNDKISYSSGMKGMWERWLNSWIPTSPLGEHRVNPYTGETQTKYAIPVVGELLKSGLIGPRIYWTEMSETETFAKEYGVKKNQIEAQITIDGQKIILDNALELNTYYGQLNKKSLAELKNQKHYVLMDNGSYQTLTWNKMNDAQCARVIDRTMTQNAKIAKIYIWTHIMGNKYQADNTLWQNLKDLDITQNIYRGGKGFVKQE